MFDIVKNLHSTNRPLVKEIKRIVLGLALIMTSAFLMYQVLHARSQVQSPNPASFQTTKPPRAFPSKPASIEYITLLDQRSWLVADAASVWTTANSGQTWTNVYKATTNGTRGKQIHGMCFLDQNVGFLIANESLLRSDDGGANWRYVGVILPNPKLGFLESCFFIDSSRGWAVGALWGEGWVRDPTIPAYRGVILSTGDGGRTWQEQTLNSATHATEKSERWSLRDVFFTEPNTGWLAGDGVLFRTVDAGQTWNICHAPYATYNHITFIGEQFGWATEWQGGRVAVSTDGGRDWKFLESVPNFGALSARTLFLTPRRGFLTLLALYDTFDGGRTWRWRVGGNKAGQLTFDYVGRALDGALVAIGLNHSGITALISNDNGESWNPPRSDREN